jgi:hypothetical protein
LDLQTDLTQRCFRLPRGGVAPRAAPTLSPGRRTLFLALAACCLVCIGGPDSGYAAAAATLSCHPTTAFATSDNDIRLEEADARPKGAAIQMPLAVAEAIRKQANDLVRKIPSDMTEGRKCSEYFGDTYKISLPGMPDLFVGNISMGLEIDYFVLVLHDPASGAISQHPLNIFAKWTQLFGASDELITKPFVSSADLLQDGHRQIVFEERVHNGNVYSGVIYHYFKIGPTLDLARILAHEANVIYFDHTFVREMTRPTPNRVRLDTFSTSRAGGGTTGSLGYVILEKKDPDTVFKVAEHHPAKNAAMENNRVLVTFGNGQTNDNGFLRDGYTFDY